MRILYAIFTWFLLFTTQHYHMLKRCFRFYFHPLNDDVGQNVHMHNLLFIPNVPFIVQSSDFLNSKMKHVKKDVVSQLTTLLQLGNRKTRMENLWPASNYDLLFNHTKISYHTFFVFRMEDNIIPNSSWNSSRFREFSRHTQHNYYAVI